MSNMVYRICRKGFWWNASIRSKILSTFLIFQEMSIAECGMEEDQSVGFDRIGSFESGKKDSKTCNMAIRTKGRWGIGSETWSLP